MNLLDTITFGDERFCKTIIGEEGFGENGIWNTTNSEYNPLGFNQNSQYKKPPFQGWEPGDPYDPNHDPNGFNADGIHFQTGTQFNESGCSQSGFTESGQVCDPGTNGPYYWLESGTTTEGIAFSNDIKDTLKPIVLAQLSNQLGLRVGTHYLLRDREKILDLFELLVGARFNLCLCRLGGVSVDVTDGFLDRVVDFCELMRSRIKEYNDLLTFNETVVQRTKGIGLVYKCEILNYSISGILARASGVSLDIRQSDAEDQGYDLYDFDNNVALMDKKEFSDVYDRLVLYIFELMQSSKLIRQMIETLPSGAIRSSHVERMITVPPGESYSRLESPRGIVGCHVVSKDGDVFLPSPLKPKRSPAGVVRFKGKSNSDNESVISLRAKSQTGNISVKNH